MEAYKGFEVWETGEFLKKVGGAVTKWSVFLESVKMQNAIFHWVYKSHLSRKAEVERTEVWLS